LLLALADRTTFDRRKRAMTRRYVPGALLVLLLGWPAAVAQQPKTAGFRDDFTTDSRKDYTVAGEVAWRRGAIVLGANASLRRAGTVSKSRFFRLGR
jgi:hypothetical protein